MLPALRVQPAQLLFCWALVLGRLLGTCQGWKHRWEGATLSNVPALQKPLPPSAGSDFRPSACGNERCPFHVHCDAWPHTRQNVEGGRVMLSLPVVQGASQIMG